MASTSSVTVALRIKPGDPEDQGEKGCLEVTESSDGQKALVTVKGKAGAASEFAFDTIFMDSNPPERVQNSGSAVLPNTQREVFRRIARPLCRAVLQGMHASILAYGQTGSGKTYTILGPLDSDRQRDPEQIGLLPRCLRYLFKRLPRPTSATSDGIPYQSPESHEGQDEDDDGEPDDKNHKVISWKMEVQFVEIYQERLFDLLAPPLQQQSSLPAQTLNSGFLNGSTGTYNNTFNASGLAVRYDKYGKGAHVAGATRREVACLDEALEAFRVGLRLRRTSETKLNTSSSRSHAIFSVFLSQTVAETIVGDETNSTVTAQLHLVDLAGSERQKDTQAVGERLREAGKINSSLSILSQVVRELAENGGSSGHVPYRDSKLTFLLMNSLGGTGKAAVIATLNQQQQHSAETRSTLAFAALSKGVRLRPVANQTLTLSHERLMALVRERAEMAAEVKRLKALIRSGCGEASDKAERSLRTEDGMSTVLLRSLLDATEAAEIARTQLRTILRFESIFLRGEVKRENVAASRPERGAAVLSEEAEQDSQQQTQQQLVQLLLRHSVYSTDLLSQLREKGFEKGGDVDTFLRLQVLLVRLLETQNNGDQGSDRAGALDRRPRASLPTSAAVAAALASALEKTIPFLKTTSWHRNQQQNHQEAAEVARTPSEEVASLQSTEPEGNAGSSSALMETTSKGDGNTVGETSASEASKVHLSWEPQILAAAQLLEGVVQAALLDTALTEEDVGGLRATEARLVCARQIDETLKRLGVMRGFMELKRQRGGEDACSVVQDEIGSGVRSQSRTAESPSEGQPWHQENHPDSRLATLANRSAKAAQETTSSAQGSHTEISGHVPPSNSSATPRESASHRPALHVSAAQPQAETPGEFDGGARKESSSTGSSDCELNHKRRKELLESERRQNRALKSRLHELEGQLSREAALSNSAGSPVVQEKEEEHQIMRLPFAIPLCAVCDGNRILGGHFVFCIHAKSGEPFAPGSPSYRGPCYISLWEKSAADEKKRGSLLIDSVSFALIKKVSRVLEGAKEHAKPTEISVAFPEGLPEKPSERSGDMSLDNAPQASKRMGIFDCSRYLYRLYFRQPVSISQEAKADMDHMEPTLINWITLAIDEAAVRHWDVVSLEDCDRLVLRAMRRGAGKHRRHSGSVSSQMARENAAMRELQGSSAT